MPHSRDNHFRIFKLYCMYFMEKDVWRVKLHLGYSIRFITLLQLSLTRSMGDIILGGLITPLALTFNYDLSSLREPTRSTKIDMESYLAMRILIKEGDIYNLVLKNAESPYLVLNLEKTTIQQQENQVFPVHGQHKPWPPFQCSSLQQVTNRTFSQVSIDHSLLYLLNNTGNKRSYSSSSIKPVMWTI